MEKSNEVFNNLNISRNNLNLIIADKIQNLIASEKLGRGTRIPPERDLASLLNVNRNTLREALRILQQRGLIEMKPGKGTYIIDVPVSTITDSIQRFSEFGNIALSDLMELREIIEPEIAALAAVKATPEQLMELENHVEKLKQCCTDSDIQQYVLEDEQFHENLAECTGNELLIALVKGLRKNMIGLREKIIEEISDLNNKANREVLEAIKRKNPTDARKAMIRHMQIAKKAFLYRR